MIRLEHIGIAVNSFDDCRTIIDRLLDRTDYKTETVDREGVTTHFVDAGTKLEFVESLDDKSSISKFLSKHGQGVHHLAFEVADVNEWRGRLIDAGFNVLGSDVTNGADGKSIFFVHPRDTFGVLFEFTQSTRPIWNTATVVELGWKSFFCGSQNSPPLILLVDQDRTNELRDVVGRLEAHARIEMLPIPDDDLKPDTATRLLRYLRTQYGDAMFNLFGLGTGVFLAMDLAEEASHQAGRLALDVGALPAHFYTRVVQQADALKHATLLIAGDHTMVHAGELLAKTKSDWVSLGVLPNADAALTDGNSEIYSALLKDHLLA